MTPLQCRNCGAPLEIEEGALDARCAFCDVITRVAPPAPPHAAHTPTAASASTRLWAWSALGITVALGGIAMGLLVVAGPRTVAAPPARDTDQAAEAHARLAERVRELMLQRQCTTLVEPSDLRGAYDLVNTLQAGSQAPCVTFLAESSTPEQVLKLWLNEPSGAAVQTPAPARTLEVRYCALHTGSHPARLVPQGERSYSVAVLECPR